MHNALKPVDPISILLAKPILSYRTVQIVGQAQLRVYLITI